MYFFQLFSSKLFRRKNGCKKWFFDSLKKTLFARHDGVHQSCHELKSRLVYKWRQSHIQHFISETRAKQTNKRNNGLIYSAAQAGLTHTILLSQPLKCYAVLTPHPIKYVILKMLPKGLLT